MVMRIQSCPVCGAEMIDTEVCENCSQIKAKRKKKPTFFTAQRISWAVAAIGVFLFIQWLKTPDDPKDFTTLQEQRANDVGDTHSAWAYVQIAVEGTLKSPSSAEFPFSGHRSVKYLGEGRYAFDSYVDAQNSFGAVLRTHFRGVIKRVEGGWQIEEIEFYLIDRNNLQIITDESVINL